MKKLLITASYLVFGLLVLFTFQACSTTRHSCVDDECNVCYSHRTKRWQTPAGDVFDNCEEDDDVVECW